MVIDEEEIRIRFTYPLRNPTTITFHSKGKGGFTRMDLFKAIYKGYKSIYDEGEKAVGDPGTYEGMYNRRESDGPYGIWGHYLGALVIEIIEYDPSTKTITLALSS